MDAHRFLPNTKFCEYVRTLHGLHFLKKYTLDNYCSFKNFCPSWSIRFHHSERSLFFGSGVMVDVVSSNQQVQNCYIDMIFVIVVVGQHG